MIPLSIEIVTTSFFFALHTSKELQKTEGNRANKYMYTLKLVLLFLRIVLFLSLNQYCL